MIKERYLYNCRIIALIENDPIINKHVEEICKCIKLFPDQRFGQILCNYIFTDYQKIFPLKETHLVMNKFFNIKCDPFYEESEITYKRLSK